MGVLKCVGCTRSRSIHVAKGTPPKRIAGWFSLNACQNPSCTTKWGGGNVFCGAMRCSAKLFQYDKYNASGKRVGFTIRCGPCDISLGLPERYGNDPPLDEDYWEVSGTNSELHRYTR